MLVKLRLSKPEIVGAGGTRPLCAALGMLLRAYCYSASVRANRWQYAIELEEFRFAGVSRSELRWLLSNGLVLHAQEIAGAQGTSRRFIALPRHLLPRDSCFVLSDAGVAACSKSAEHSKHELVVPRGLSIHGSNGLQSLREDCGQRQSEPLWDCIKRELRIRNLVVKQYRSPAVNQEAILAAFQEEGWPPRIDDPLPPAGEQVPHRRLSDTIKCLNGKQVNPLLRFHGDGTGKGVLWEHRHQLVVDLPLPNPVPPTAHEPPPDAVAPYAQAQPRRVVVRRRARKSK